MLSSCGAACFHSPFSLKFAGGGSLKAGGTGAAGVLYFGPMEQAESRKMIKKHETSGNEKFEIGRILHFKSEIRNLKLDGEGSGPIRNFEISDLKCTIRPISKSSGISLMPHLGRVPGIAGRVSGVPGGRDTNTQRVSCIASRPG